MENKKMNGRIDKIIVHAGTFHSDDVMCAAIARALNPHCIIERSLARQFPEEEGTIVADVGGGRYDHHQPDAKRRADGRKHAGCGLVFEEFWSDICPYPEFFEEMERKYIVPIEDADNGHERNPLSDLIASCNPTWDEDRTADDCFLEAVEICLKLIHCEVARIESERRARDVVDRAIAEMEDGIILLPKYVPWQTRVIQTSKEARYVVHPSNRGGYDVWRVPKELGSFEPRVLFPDSLTAESEGCTFLHPDRFIAVFDTEAHAVKALKKEG